MEDKEEKVEISVKEIRESWNEFPNPLNFEKLAEVARHLLNQAYDLELVREEDEDLLYLGPEVNKRFLASRPSQSESLQAESINFEKEDQGRDELDQILSVVLMMGVEQGLRISETWRNQKDLDFMLEEVIDNLRSKDKNHSVSIQILKTVLDQFGHEFEVEASEEDFEPKNQVKDDESNEEGT